MAPAIVQGEKPYHSKIIVASNLRDKMKDPIGEGIGFYAGGVQLNFNYNLRKNFWENVRKFHRQAIPQYTNKNFFNECLTWSYLDPTISESMNFKKIGGLVSSENDRHEKLFAFSQRDDVILSIMKRENLDTFDKIIIGTAVTNLTRLDFPKMFGALELDRIMLKPGGAFPLSNINILLGAVTCSGKLSLVLEYSDKNITPDIIEKIKEQAMAFLLSS